MSPMEATWVSPPRHRLVAPFQQLYQCSLEAPAAGSIYGQAWVAVGGWQKLPVVH